MLRPGGGYNYYAPLDPGTAAVSSLKLTNDLVFPYGVDDEIRVSPDGGCFIQSIRQDPLGPDTSPVFLVRHPWMLSAVAAHEYGHDLMGTVSLLGGCRGHITTESAYGLMNGSMTPPVLLMSGIMRMKLGWIDPVEVTYPTSFPYQTTVTISADYEDGNDCFLLVPTHVTNPAPPKGTQYFLLEARKPGLAEREYNAVNPAPSEYPNCCYPMREVGEGLLIAHIREGGDCCYPLNNPPPEHDLPPPLVSFEVATGLFNLGTGAPDPVGGLNHLLVDSRKQCGAGGLVKGPELGMVGDLFRPKGFGADLLSNMFTPFTNPNTNLYVDEPATIPTAQSIYSGISFYDIEWVANTNDIRVKIRFDDPTNPPIAGGADTLRTSMTCDGLLQLTGDLVIPTGVSLTVKEGSRVVTTVESDRHSGGKDASKVEWITMGKLAVLGSPAHPVRMISYRDDEFEEQAFRKDWADGVLTEPGPPAAGNWYGLRFLVDGCERAGYGYMGSTSHPSTIENSEVAHSDYGARIEKFVAPSLKSVQFNDVTDGRHIYLDKTDVFLSVGYWWGGGCNSIHYPFFEDSGEWDLMPGTRIVASTATPVADADFIGTEDKVDLVVNGVLRAIGGSVPGDSVYFVPDTITPVSEETAGADWGGLTFSTEYPGNEIRHSQIGHAANPLFVAYPNGTTISNSRIHHFADLGIWFRGSTANGAVLDSSVVDRGEGLESSLGDTGIYVDQADELQIRKTLVDLVDREDDSGAIGIDVWFGKMFSETAPSETRSLLIENCQVVGPGQGVQLGDHYSGLRATWVGGSTYRDIDFVGNYLGDWKFVGLEAVQSADVQFTCNRVVASGSGADIYRDDKPTGSSMRFRRNQLQAAQSDIALFAVRTNKNLRTRLGPSQAQLYGLNRLSVNVQDTRFIVENDAGADSLNAWNNFWYTVDGGTSTLLTAEPHIRSRIQENPANTVKVSGFETIDAPVEPDCNPPAPPPPSRAHQGLQHALVGDGASTPSIDSDAPRFLELGPVFPNPARQRHFEVDLAVPSDRTGTFSLEVFDLQGRRVAAQQHEVEASGRYRLGWDGRAATRLQVSSGIYFLRVIGPGGFVATRKITVLK